MSLVRFFLVFGVVVCLASCKSVSYSFTGANISPETQSFSVDFFTSSAPLAPPSLPQVFTEKLKDVFLNQTSLSLKSESGDIQFSGVITGYSVRPVAVQGDEIAAQNQLTINVKVKYVDTKDDKNSFDRSFSSFSQFDNTQDLTAVQDELIEQINDQLAQEIFNASVGNW